MVSVNEKEHAKAASEGAKGTKRKKRESTQTSTQIAENTLWPAAALAQKQKEAASFSRAAGSKNGRHAECPAQRSRESTRSLSTGGPGALTSE